MYLTYNLELLQVLFYLLYVNRKYYFLSILLIKIDFSVIDIEGILSKLSPEQRERVLNHVKDIKK